MIQLTSSTRDIVAKLWSECKTLQGGGVTYFQYVTELTYLLFLKMMEETGQETLIPQGFRWRDVASLGGDKQLFYYQRVLLELGNPENADVKSETVRSIYFNAKTALSKPVDLKLLTTAIDKLDWFSAKEDGLGNLYEGLLEKTTSETKSKAGQYFTPRPLIDCIVRMTKPKAGEIVQDAAAGTGGFLISADQYIKSQTDDLYSLEEDQQLFQRTQAFVGLEFVQDTRRLCLMNLLLHGIESGVEWGDTLTSDGERLPKADVIMSNPPFNKFSAKPSRSDFSVTANVAKGPLSFMEHFIRSLKPGGRAAVVIPDGVLSNDEALSLRRMLLDLCNLHTILRLPTGIFYAPGVKTNVVFFTRGTNDRGNTHAVWVYDMRANAPSYGKTRPLTVRDFTAFEACFGDGPAGQAARRDQGDAGRFRCFTRAQIAERNDNLDIAWLRDESPDPEDTLTEPEELVGAIAQRLRNALEEIGALNDDFVPTDDIGQEIMAV